MTGCTVRSRRSEASINAKLAGGLPFLATVGATAPFIGLFGTVVGIYGALINIGIAGSASIDKVAGPVGEALIMTALGLLVAVPAVLAYNFLQARNKRIAELLSGFSTDVLANLASKGVVEPALPAAPAAKPRCHRPRLRPRSKARSNGRGRRSIAAPASGTYVGSGRGVQAFRRPEHPGPSAQIRRGTYQWQCLQAARAAKNAQCRTSTPRRSWT